jgi:hypothetical protein
MAWLVVIFHVAVVAEIEHLLFILLIYGLDWKTI